MAELPQEARAALVAARFSYTPNAERLERLQGRIQQAVINGAAPSVPSEVAQGERFVGIESARPWYLELGKTFVSVLAMGFVVLCVLVLSRPKLENAEQPAQFNEVELTKTPVSEPVAPRLTTHTSASVEALEAREPHPRQVPPSTTPLSPAVSAPPADAPVPSVGVRPSFSPRARAAQTSQRAQDPLGPEFDPPERPEAKRGVQADRVASANEPTRFGASSSSANVGNDRLAEEVQLVEQARRALESGQIAEAEHYLRQHRRDFPGGQLVSERTALETRARCSAKDRAGARSLFQELLLRSPKSSLKRAVERACGELLTP